MAWVALYSGLTDTNALAVAREVAASISPAAALLPGAPLLGIAIHLALSVALGLALGKTLLGPLAPRFGRKLLMPTVLGTLACIWAVNFLLVLPLLNPAFLALMPLAATLTSKLLFGLAAAGILRLAPTA
jgi:MFS family permease